MSKFIRDTAVVALTPSADHSAARGRFVTYTGTTAVLVTSAAAIPYGVIIDGEDPTNDPNAQDTIGVCGGNIGTVRLKAGGTIAAGALLQLTATGTVITDAATGARVIVGRAMESAVSGDLFEAIVIFPDPRT